MLGGSPETRCRTADLLNWLNLSRLYRHPLKILTPQWAVGTLSATQPVAPRKFAWLPAPWMC